MGGDWECYWRRLLAMAIGGTNIVTIWGRLLEKSISAIEGTNSDNDLRDK